MELLESFLIDGKPFIGLADEINDVRVFLNVFKPHFTLDENGFHVTVNINLIRKNTENFITVTKIHM